MQKLRRSLRYVKTYGILFLHPLDALSISWWQLAEQELYEMGTTWVPAKYFDMYFVEIL